MKLLGSIELGTNSRITLPARAIEAVKFEPGMILLVYEHGGNLVIRKPKGDE